MKLKEIIAEIIEKKFPELPETQRPRALARVLDVGEMDARRLIVAGRNQEKLFTVIIMKLLPLCEELGIDPAQELIKKSASQQPKELNDATRIIKRHGAGAISKDVNSRSVHKITQRDKNHISPGQAESHQRRKSGQE
jgi:hypothetical protein